jgi:hypothetical protein
MHRAPMDRLPLSSPVEQPRIMDDDTLRLRRGLERFGVQREGRPPTPSRDGAISPGPTSAHCLCVANDSEVPIEALDLLCFRVLSG